MKDSYYIDLDIGRAYLLHEYLNRQHVLNRLYPIKDGVEIPEPEFSGDWSKYADAWRIEYDDTNGRYVRNIIIMWGRMRDKGLQYCPFCGDICTVREEQEFDPFDENDVQSIYYILCLGCLGHGPKRDTEQDAIDTWNRRF